MPKRKLLLNIYEAEHTSIKTSITTNAKFLQDFEELEVEEHEDTHTNTQASNRTSNKHA